MDVIFFGIFFSVTDWDNVFFVGTMEDYVRFASAEKSFQKVHFINTFGLAVWSGKLKLRFEFFFQ